MQVLLEHLEANFKNLYRMELTSDLTLQFFSSLNNNFFFLFFFFVPIVGCEIECVRATESTDKIWMHSFPGEKQIYREIPEENIYFFYKLKLIPRRNDYQQQIK